MPHIFWVFVAAMVVIWGLMNFGTAPRIEELSGGLRLLDMRFTGYSFDDARTYIAALGDEGTELYLNKQLRLDMVFPPLLGAVLFLTFRWLFPGWVGWTIGALSLTSIPVDYLENAALAAMLRAGADGITPQMAEPAHQWTTLKWIFAFVGLLALVVGFVVRLYRRLANR